MLTTKRTDNYDSISWQCENEDGSRVDLTGASAQFIMGKKNKLITNAPAQITSAADGIVEYKLTNSDTLVAGTFLGEFEITFPTGEKKTFPSNGYITVAIGDNLDNGQVNVVLDMIAAKQGDFEAKLSAILAQAGNINMSSIDEYSWSAIANQVSYTFPITSSYTQNAKWFKVYVGGIPVDDSLINRSFMTSFELMIDPTIIKEGTTVKAEWMQPMAAIAPTSYKVIPQQDIPPVDAVEGDLWFDTSDDTYQGTILEGIDTRMTNAETSLADITKHVKTLSDLTASVTLGKNLIVMNGTYTLTADLTSMSNGIVIEGQNNTIINGGGHSFNIPNLQNVTFKNITFQNFGNLQLTTPTNIIFDNCKFNNFVTYGVTITNYNNIKFINGCSWNGIGSTSVDSTYQGAAIYANNGDKLIVEDFEMQNTYGQGAIFLVGGATNFRFRRFSIHDTQYRGINSYTGTYSGIMEHFEIYNCGFLRPGTIDNGATTGRGVGCNGIYGYGTADQSGVTARHGRIRNVYENGMECGYGLIEDITIENTAIDLVNHYTPSTSGIYIQAVSSYLNVIKNVRVRNSVGNGIDYFSSSATIQNLHMYDITIEDDNANLSTYGVSLNSQVGYSNVIVDGLKVINKTPMFMANKVCTQPVYVSSRSFGSGISLPSNNFVRTKDGLILNSIQNKEFSSWATTTSLSNWTAQSSTLSQVADDNSYIPQLTVTAGGFPGRIVQDIILPKGLKGYYLRVMFKANNNMTIKVIPYNSDGTTLNTGSAVTVTSSSFSTTAFQELTLLAITNASKVQVYFGTSSSTQGDTLTIQSIQERIIY